MEAAGSSPTPQWDSRNRGFIPPSQLQRLRQSSPLARELPSDRPRSMAATSFPSPSPSLRPSPTMASTHSRSSSFFSFLKSNDNSPSTMPSRSAEPSPRHQNSNEIGLLSQEPRQPSLPSPSALDRSSSASVPAQSQPMQLHPEIRSVVTLTHAHAHKVYMSGPLIRRVERLPDGHNPIKDEGWRDVWAQLGGTTLSIWDMKEIDEASKQGKEVPPTYINVTDAVSLYFYHNSYCHLTVVLVCASARRRYDTRVRASPRSEIQQCCHRQHRGIQPPPLLLPQFSLSYIMGYGLSTRRLGESTP